MSEGPLILLVEDEVVSLRLYDRVLRRAGYRTLTAGNAHTAIKHFSDHRDALRLVVLDERLPDMPGSEVLWWIRQQRAELMVIIVSGQPPLMPEADPQLRFLSKPFLPEVLVHTVQTVLSEG
ncbi:MAG: response regulator [Myxococcota bacterium]